MTEKKNELTLTFKIHHNLLFEAYMAPPKPPPLIIHSKNSLQSNASVVSFVNDKLFMSVQSDQLFCLSQSSQALVAFFLLDLRGAS